MWQATYTRPPKDQVFGTSPYSESNHGCTMPSYRRHLSTLDSGIREGTGNNLLDTEGHCDL